MSGVGGVFSDAESPGHAPPGVNVLQGWKGRPDGALGQMYHLLQGFLVLYGTVPVPGGDASSQDALDDCGVERL